MIYKIWKESGIFENAIRVGGFSSTKYIKHCYETIFKLRIERNKLISN